jgi:glycosyltransferase involved in cell wall biosynthesis
VTAGRPSVSVVVCAYTDRRWHDIVRAVASVAAQTRRADELLLVIDHNEALAERAAAEMPGVKVMSNIHARGLSGARNTGVEMAAGEVIAFLDDDAAARPDWLERLLAPYADASVAAVGGAAFPLWPAAGRPAVLPAPDGTAAGELDWVVGCSYTGQPTGLAGVRNLMGCNMSFRRDVFAQVGGFSDDIGRIGSTPLGCEETELCIRLRQRTPEARIVFEPAAVVTHRVGEARTGWRYLVRRCWAEGLSKAAISRTVGREDALSAERAYLTRVLPAAVARQLAAAARGRLGALAGALAVVAAVLFTATGYLWGLRRGRAQMPDAGPIAVAEVDLQNPPDELRVGLADGREYRRAQVLLRAGHRTAGMTWPPVRDGVVDLTGLTVPAFAVATANREPRAEQQPLVSVVIPTIRPQGLVRCVKSLLGTGYPNLEVLAVDNRPSRAAAGMVESLTADHGVRYLHEPRPGVSNARNTGLAAARGEYVALVDDDMEVDRWWLHNLVAELADGRIDCATSLVLPARLDTAAQRAFEQLKGFGQGTVRRVYGPEPGLDDPASAFAPGRLGPASASMWRRSALLGIGGFEPLLGVGSPSRGGEDLYALLRLARAGGTVVYTPHAVTWHEHRTEWADLRHQLRGYGTGLSAMILLHLWRNPGDVVLVARAMPGRLGQLARRGRTRDAAPHDAVSRLLLVEELRGIACGPLALLRSARLASRMGVPR